MSKQVGICHKLINEINDFDSSVHIRMVSIKLLLKVNKFSII